MIEIVEVLRRSEQGMTRPFICRGDDDEFYFVKGHDAGGRSLVCEWICGGLGRALGLPIAPFEIVNVPTELMGLDPALELQDLAAGPAFGSREQRVAEISMAATDDVPNALQRDVLLFDWWIKNGDRNLSEHGGNPNLFWEPDARELVVIDHNLAFEFDLSFNDFIQHHIFRDRAREVFGDFLRRGEYTERLSSALERWDTICSSLPPEWLYLDSDMMDPINLDLDDVHALLMRFEDDNFWKWQ